MTIIEGLPVSNIKMMQVLQAVQHPFVIKTLDDLKRSELYSNYSLYPIGSMYAIYGNIYHQYGPKC